MIGGPAAATTGTRMWLWVALVVGASVVGASVLAGCGSSSTSQAGASPTAADPGRGTVTTAYLAQAKAQVLVTGAGHALYVFAPDRRSRVSCVATCAALWPPLQVPSSGSIASAGQVRRALLGADADRSLGAHVVTYDGWPLYTYQADLQPDYATGEGVDLNGGYWYLMAPDGSPVVPAGDPSPVS